MFPHFPVFPLSAFLPICVLYEAWSWDRQARKAKFKSRFLHPSKVCLHFVLLELFFFFFFFFFFSFEITTYDHIHEEKQNKKQKNKNKNKIKRQ